MSDGPIGAAVPVVRGFVWAFPGQVESVTDGDTVICNVVWRPGDSGHDVRVRVDGVNALELSAKFGAEARDFARFLLPKGTPVTLLVRKEEKYGRLLARIILPDGRDFSQELLVVKASDGATPLAVPYNP